MTTTNTLPALPDGSDARLPVAYETARKSLAECERLDECRGWADRAAALASYARQAKDDSLHRMAQRIQARAVRRCGELLKQIQRGDANGVNLVQNRQVGALPPVTRTEAADAAGLSEHQRKTGLRVASIPEADFEAAIESDTPPTVTALAQLGTVPRTRVVLDEQFSTEADPQAASALASLLQFAEFCRASSAEDAAGAVSPDEAPTLRRCITLIDRWLDRFVTTLPSERP